MNKTQQAYLDREDFQSIDQVREVIEAIKLIRKHFPWGRGSFPYMQQQASFHNMLDDKERYLYTIVTTFLDLEIE